MNQISAQIKKVPYQVFLAIAVICFAASIKIDGNVLTIVATVFAVLGALGYNMKD